MPERLDVRTGDAAFALRSEGIRRAARRIGPQHLDRTRADVGWRGALRGKWTRLDRVLRRPVQQSSHGGSAVEGRRVVPPFPERERHVVDRRPFDPDLHVVPGRGRAVVRLGEVGGLWVAAVIGVVAPAVCEVHAPDERDVVRRVVGPAHDHQLLVVGAAAPDALVEEHLTPRVVHRPAEEEVLGLVVHERVRAPDQAAHRDATTRRVGEHRADLTAFVGQQLGVGVALEPGEEHGITGPGLAQGAVEGAEVLDAVDEHLDRVALGPRNAVVACVDPCGGVPTFGRGEEPVVDGHSAPPVPADTRSCWASFATHSFGSCGGAMPSARTASSCAATAAP